MKMRLVYNIFNSIIYFSLVTKIKIRFILLPILCLKQGYSTSYDTVIVVSDRERERVCGRASYSTVFLHALFTTMVRWVYTR